MNRPTCLALATILLASGCGVQSPLQVSTNNLPSASLKQSYSVRLQAVGATPPFAWSVASGSLPPGVTLSTQTGMLSGTPQAEGEFDFTVQVTDVEIPSLTAQSPDLKIKVHKPGTSNPVTLVTTALPGGSVKTPYTAALEAAGGTAPYKWSVTSGSIPTGLTLASSTGMLSGTPSASGQFSFGVQVQDSSSPPEHASGNFTVDIVSSSTTNGPSPLQVSTNSLPSGAVKVAYSAAVKASGGTAPYTWNVVSGTIPPGLALSPSGTIAGTPTQAGSYLFTAQVKDSTGAAASSSLTASIAPASSPVISNISPTSGPTSGGTTVTISGSNFAAGATVSFGGVAASASLVSSSQMHAITPAHVTGSVEVSVQENGQTSTLASAFTYNAVWPTVSGISPNSGPTAGGTTVTITGTNFLAGALVLFGSIQAPTIKLVSSTQIQAVTPPSASGAVNVTVENTGDLSAKLSSAFTYEAATAPLTITSISPTSGAPGAQITITGTGFNSADAVSFGGTAAHSTSYVSSTQLLATVPSIATGTYTITVTDPDPASATLSNSFTVTAPPAAQSLLSGCTVSASNVPSCATPSGWSLAIAQGFESGGVGPSETLGGSSISTTQAHTGTHALVETISANGGGNVSPGGAWELNAAGVGCCSGSEFYASWWTYLDPTAQAQTESFFGWMLSADKRQWLIMDTQNPPGGLTLTPNLWFSPQSNASPSDCANTANAKNCGSYGANWHLNLGAWEQEELWIHADTCSNGTPNDDGFVRFFINGKLVYQINNAKQFDGPMGNGGNMNGCVDMSNPEIGLGGIWTYFVANPTTFHKYIDDIIVLKR